MSSELTWTCIGETDNFPMNLSTCVKVNDIQIAVFQLPTEKKWYAVQNYNPINQRMVLSRGLVGDSKGEPYVACPLHKHHYSLETGACMTVSNYELQTFEIKEDGGKLMLSV